MHVQSVQNYCFSLSNMQICEVFVAVVVVDASAPYKLQFSRIRFFSSLPETTSKSHMPTNFIFQQIQKVSKLIQPIAK